MKVIQRLRAWNLTQSVLTPTPTVTVMPDQTTTAPAIDLTKFDVALNSRSYASANASGAESFPMGKYSFVVENDSPRLIGGQWKDGAIINDVYEPRKNNAGIELPADQQPLYVGGQKSIKFVVSHNESGLEYRLSSTAFETAFKSLTKKMSFAGLEMSQKVDDSSGYSKSTVTLG